MTKKFVCQYEVLVTVPGANGHTKTLHKHDLYKVFNRAWGFISGYCNKQDPQGNFVSTGVYPEGYETAFKHLPRSSGVTLVVSVFSDGSKTFVVKE